MTTSPRPIPEPGSTDAINGQFPTRDTDFGACLGALGVPIRQFRRIREAGSSQATTWYIFACGNQEATVSSSSMHWAWNHREEFERNNPLHPLVTMRAAVDSIKWITRVYFGHERFTPNALPPGDFFETDDWTFAACLRACRNRVATFNARAVKFPLLRDDETLQALRSEYVNYALRWHDPTAPKSAIQWMRAALEIRATLIEKTKPGNGLRTETRYVKGDPQTKGTECFIFDDCPDAERRELLARFHQS